MKKYWCVNFDEAENLRHGIQHRCWMMGYQYELRGETDPTFKGLITRNWRRLLDIQIGDEFVAYLPKNLFFATGTVTEPHRKKLSTDKKDSIENYLAQKKAYSKGFVYFTDVVYENFTDKRKGYPVRVDVELWKNFCNKGVSTKVLGSLPVHEKTCAAFQITKDQFRQISKDLAKGESSGSNSNSNPLIFQNSKKTPEAKEPKLSKSNGQGFLSDSELKKQIEDYSMDRAIKHFESEGYTVFDRSKHCSFDLECVKEGKTVYVEVKGTRGKGEGVILTTGEVEFARKHVGKMALFIVHSIKAEDKHLSKGVDYIVKPWNIADHELSAFQYKYAVPIKKVKKGSRALIN